MGMTNRQFQGMLRLILALIDNALKINPDNEPLKQLQNIVQDMIEDGVN